MVGKRSIIFCDTTDLMVYGHELWLEMVGSHGHAGGSVEVYVKWGHNMRADGLARKEGMAALVVAPGGEKEELVIADGGPDYYLLRFPTPAEGFYHVIAQNTGSYVLDKKGRYHQGTRREHPDVVQSVLYNQYAQAFVPVGHDPEGVPQRVGMPLEIIPAVWKQWRVGDEIGLQVQFRGEPLDGVALDVACNGPGGYRQWQEMTDVNGCIILQAREPGRYLVVARYRVPEGEEGVCDVLSLTTTLCFIVMR
ncbi:DUF4198 domain-containing protein [Desulfovirgula thermocuniculi]|uniref:DUF4198 domain-containing protein n=1 Tax=Desulfovirgula thermocuniculi TaxID=348842 RepID=UPI000419B772|nr:DUF4198 domain-containing protein [Desulfovirgula thermocuniculi]